MFWDKFSRKEKIGSSLALIIVLFYVSDQFIIRALWDRFQRVNRAIKVGEKQLGHDLRNVHQKEQISKEYEKYVQYIQRSGSDEEEVAKILGEIESLARQSQIYLVDMKPQTPKEVDFYKGYAVEIAAEGEMASLTTFLYQLNTSPQLLRVEKLRLNSKKKGDKTLKSSMLITKILVL